jgi:hypothetical protein
MQRFTAPLLRNRIQISARRRGILSGASIVAEFNWGDVVPERVARQQLLWELRRRIKWALQSGASTSELADRFHVSRTRICQIRDCRRPSPVRSFLAHNADLMVSVRAVKKKYTGRG